jgi:hypothetical protein
MIDERYARILDEAHAKVADVDAARIALEAHRRQRLEHEVADKVANWQPPKPVIEKRERPCYDFLPQAWREEIHRDIEAAITAERATVIEIVAMAIAETLDQEHERYTRDLHVEVAELTSELAELKTLTRQLRVCIEADRKQPLDLPALPRRELN